MRIGVSLVLVASSSSAFAETRDRWEASGFFGIDYFGDQVGLGGAQVPEQRPQTAPTFGGRITYLPLILGGDIHFDVGLEAELAFTPSWTGYGFDGQRPSVFAPVFGYHANLLLRLGGGWMQPHVTAGGGGATVTSSSEYMTQDTDPVFLWGLGASFPVDSWQLRMDARQGIMEGIDGTATLTYEAHVSIGATFGGPAKNKVELEKAPTDVIAQPVTPASTLPDPNADADGDGVVDRIDACPQQAESANGVDDQDGCPEPDPDRDGIVGSADMCPERAEDADMFEDGDGCPDADNDKDGIADGKDACPLEAEVVNGIKDDDGCPDQIPATVTTALASASGVTFEAGKARLNTAAKKALDKAMPAMLSNKRMKFTITTHPEQDGPADAELAQKRAEAVKWYLVEQGAAVGNLSTAVGAIAAKKAPLLVLSITP